MEVLSTAAEYQRLTTALRGGKGPAAAFGVPTGVKAHLLASLAGDGKQTLLAVTATDASAVQLAGNIASFGVRTRVFLQRETPLTHVQAVSGEAAGKRIAALTDLAAGTPVVVVAAASALMQVLAPREAFAAMVQRVRTGDTLEPRELLQKLTASGYERVEAIEGPGQVAARGDLVDVFPPQQKEPVRIEFFGDEIDQMRLFDPASQRATEQVREVLLPPVYEAPQTPERIQKALEKIQGATGFANVSLLWEQGSPCPGGDVLLPLLFQRTETLLDYLPPDAILAADEPIRLDEALRTEQARFHEQVTAMLERGEGLPEQAKLERSAGEILEKLSSGRTLVLSQLTRSHPSIRPKMNIQFLARSAPQYLGSFDEIAADVRRWRGNGETVVIYAGERAERTQNTLAELGEAVPVYGTLTGPPEQGTLRILREDLAQGFCYPSLKLTVLTEYELFGKADRPAPKRRKRAALAFSELSPGDYIVHEAHGVGRFLKVEALTVDGNTRDYLLIEYKGGDRLYIPTDQLDRIQKYIGGQDEDTVVTLSKLGGSDWNNRVTRAKSAAKKLAVDLAALYAVRASRRGFAFSRDTAWQKQFEERFPYQETPDQLQSILEIKGDMEQSRPMDRLLCGDVGYGKTEVALRAAFKAVQDGKQVALLVPTTILAEQHYHTAEARFADFPVRVACLSRFAQPKERQLIKKKAAEGQIDFLIGTHALLAKDVKFKDLGLLIIDEEQRFGVNHKEQIKAIKETVDVLTLTATPIPRTLNMSMTGVRDISVIETPPEERYPVQTYVMEYTDALLSDALTREIARGGQAYVLYNRVRSIEHMARRIEELVPEARVRIAHGQMGEAALEDAMVAFLQGEADVLLCSTIIESGLDIPNANTLVVLDADRMGLAQLYQLRGRVGRSTRLGYAYLTVPGGKEMNEKAAKRLMAIREFTQFGAGFQLAMRDLEIRGAGSLLGAEQHGHITDVGYEYYTKLIRQALDEAVGREVKPPVEPNVEIPLNAHIPHGYIANEVQRLKVYRRIGEIDSRDALMDVTEELIDRYGEPPEPVNNLMRLALLKAYAARAYLAAVTVRDGQAELLFDPTARVDGGRLIAAVADMEGAQLLATDPPGIRIRQPKATAEELANKLPQFVYTIVRCAQGPEGV